MRTFSAENLESLACERGMVFPPYVVRAGVERVMGTLLERHR